MTRKERLERRRSIAYDHTMAFLSGVMWGSLAALVVAASIAWM